MITAIQFTTVDQAPGWDIRIEARITETGDDPLVSFYDLEPTDSGKMVKVPSGYYEEQAAPFEPGLINTFPLSQLKKMSRGMHLGTGRYRRAIGIYLEPYPISADDLARVVVAAQEQA